MTSQWESLDNEQFGGIALISSIGDPLVSTNFENFDGEYFSVSFFLVSFDYELIEVLEYIQDPEFSEPPGEDVLRQPSSASDVDSMATLICKKPLAYALQGELIDARTQVVKTPRYVD